MAFNIFETNFTEVHKNEDKMLEWRKYGKSIWRYFNSESLKGRRIVVLATLGFYAGIYGLIKMTKKE